MVGDTDGLEVGFRGDADGSKEGFRDGLRVMVGYTVGL